MGFIQFVIMEGIEHIESDKISESDMFVKHMHESTVHNFTGMKLSHCSSAVQLIFDNNLHMLI